MLYSKWDLSSPTRDQTHVPCIGNTEASSLDHQGCPLLLTLDFVYSFSLVPLGVRLDYLFGIFLAY